MNILDQFQSIYWCMIDFLSTRNNPLVLAWSLHRMLDMKIETIRTRFWHIMAYSNNWLWITSWFINLIGWLCISTRGAIVVQYETITEGTFYNKQNDTTAPNKPFQLYLRAEWLQCTSSNGLVDAALYFYIPVRVFHAIILNLLIQIVFKSNASV